MGTRYAVTRSELARVENYLPANYSAREVQTSDGVVVEIFGDDVAGWTLDDYVIPRLASGMHWAREVNGPIAP